ncbi:hypothetical protein Dimus_003952, partial [Dionaea muscipula]
QNHHHRGHAITACRFHVAASPHRSPSRGSPAHRLQQPPPTIACSFAITDTDEEDNNPSPLPVFDHHREERFQSTLLACCFTKEDIVIADHPQPNPSTSCFGHLQETKSHHHLLATAVADHRQRPPPTPLPEPTTTKEEPVDCSSPPPRRSPPIYCNKNHRRQRCPRHCPACCSPATTRRRCSPTAAAFKDHRKGRTP